MMTLISVLVIEIIFIMYNITGNSEFHLIGNHMENVFVISNKDVGQ